MRCGSELSLSADNQRPQGMSKWGWEWMTSHLEHKLDASLFSPHH
jgi:hypothetical protein